MPVQNAVTLYGAIQMYFFIIFDLFMMLLKDAFSLKFLRAVKMDVREHFLVPIILVVTWKEITVILEEMGIMMSLHLKGMMKLKPMVIQMMTLMAIYQKVKFGMILVRRRSGKGQPC